MPPRCRLAEIAQISPSNFRPNQTTTATAIILMRSVLTTYPSAARAGHLVRPIVSRLGRAGENPGKALNFCNILYSGIGA